MRDAFELPVLNAAPSMRCIHFAPAAIAAALISALAGCHGPGAINGEPPTISSVTPASGLTGAAVTIAGAHLDSATVVFGATPAVINADTSAQITTNVPVGAAPGPELITITTPHGSATASFTVIAQPAPMTIALHSGDGQTGLVGMPLNSPLSVLVTDSQQHGMSGVSVAWATAAGGSSDGDSGASVSQSTSVTGADGIASISATLGPRGGTNEFTATISGATGSPVRFSARAAVGMTLVSGNAQTGVVGNPLSAPLKVLVVDDNQLGVAGIAVNWATTGGTFGASSSTAASISDANGFATPPSLASLGMSGGIDSYTASFTDSPTLSPITFTAQAAAALAINAGNGQVGIVGAPLAQPLSVFISDGNANGISGIQVNWTAAGGGLGLPGSSSASASSVSDINGIASTPAILGAIATTDTFTATVDGLSGSPAIFTASAAGAVRMSSGDQQTGVAGQALANLLAVQVVDSNDAGISGIAVNWAIGAADAGAAGLGDTTGAIDPTPSVTNYDGIASVAATLGARGGPNYFTASVAGLTSSPVVFNAEAASGVSLISGNAQTGWAGEPLANPLVAQAVDNNDAGVAGIVVNWLVADAGDQTATVDSITNTTSVTTAGDGTTSINPTLGAVGGANLYIAMIPGLASSVRFSAQAATAIIADDGGAQTAISGAPLAQALVVRVVDNLDAGVAGIPINWSTSGNKFGIAITPAANTTDSTGTAIAQATLGAGGGTDTFTATVATQPNPAVTFGALAAGAIMISPIDGGNAQNADAGAQLPRPLVALVTDGTVLSDGGYIPVSGITVNWTATGGGPGVAVNPATVVTGADGLAQTTATLGATGGTNTFKASLAGIPGVASYTATANGGTCPASATPTINQFTPTDGGVGTVVTIQGNNLCSTTGVFFSNNAAAVFTPTGSPTALVAVLPAQAVTGPIKVVTTGGTVISANPFTVIAVPTISSVAPVNGAGVGVTVTIKGTNLTGTSAVSFNGAAATIQSVSATQIVTTVPAGATTGPIQVTTPGGVATSGRYTILPSPTLTSFSPAGGAGVGAPITLVGTNLIGATSLLFNGGTLLAPVSAVFLGATVTGAIPAGAVTGPVGVVTPGGTAYTSLPFTILAAPSIASISPSSAYAGTGALVTISGSQLANATSLAFNGTAALIESNTSGLITTTVPPGATTGPVTVATPGGIASAAFTVLTVGAPAPVGPAPLVITRQALAHVGAVDRMVAGPDIIAAGGMHQRNIYLGQVNSKDAWADNLQVVTLDESGNLLADRVYPDSTLPMNGAGQRSIAGLALDPAKERLYLALHEYVAVNQSLLSVWALDGGAPTGAPASYATGSCYKATGTTPISIALNPTLPILYIACSNGPTVYAVALNAAGDPAGDAGTFLVGDAGLSDVQVSHDGAHLYLGTNSDQLEIVDLDPHSGIPTSGLPRIYLAGPDPLTQTVGPLRFELGGHALYREHQPLTLGSSATLEVPPPSWPLEVWPLNAAGNPGQQTWSTPLPQFTGSAFAASPDGGYLLLAADQYAVDPFNGNRFYEGYAPWLYATDSSGAPNATGTIYATSGDSRPLLATIASDGQSVLLVDQTAPAGNLSSNLWLRTTVTAARTNADAGLNTVPYSLYGSGVTGVLTTDGGTPSAWFPLDPLLAGRNGQLLVTLTFGPITTVANNHAPTALGPLSATIEVAQGDISNLTTIASLHETVLGDTIDLMLPGYEEWQPGINGPIELLSTHIRRVYLNTAEAAVAALSPALKNSATPKQLIVSCSGMAGGQGEEQQLLDEATTLQLLGCNTVGASNWGAIPYTELRQVLLDAGLPGRGMTIFRGVPYLPNFDYEYGAPGYTPDPATLVSQWLDSTVFAANGTLPIFSGETLANVVDIKLADEPAWSYPGELNLLAASDAGLALFHAALADAGWQPGDLVAGAPNSPTGWAEVLPRSYPGLDAGTETRTLYRETMRYFPAAATRAYSEAADMLQAAFADAGADTNARVVNIDVNWATSPWYGNQSIAANPPTAFGQFDWLEVGRDGHFTPWTEDWAFFNPEDWTTAADQLRSAAMLAPAPGTTRLPRNFGGYIVGNHLLYSHPEAASFNALSLVAKGSKTVELYSFGPGQVDGLSFYDQGNTWSEDTGIYGSIARATRRIGAAESVLYPGIPARGKVALQFHSSSPLWEPSQGHLYELESAALHYALAHAGYTVDYIDDVDMESGALTARGYSALYLTEPDLTTKAQLAIVDWVNAGGTLAVVLAGGINNELDQPSAILDPVLGLSRTTIRSFRSPSTAANIFARQPGSIDYSVYQGTLATLQPTGVDSAAFGDAGVTIVGTYLPLDGYLNGGATTVATIPDGGVHSMPGPAIAVNSYGSGTAVTYGFYPGQEYRMASDNSGYPDQLPQHYNPSLRQLAVGAARLANTPQPVILDHAVVEADLLQSPAGLAVALLNWTDQYIPLLQVTIPNACYSGTPCTISSVTSSEHPAPLDFAQAGTQLTVTLPIDKVDVLIIK